MPDIKHYLRLGSIIEQKIFHDDRELKSLINNNGIALNANIVAHTPAAITKFLYINFPDTKYFIDPQTYIFQLDPIKYYSSRPKESGPLTLKKSIKNLVEEYGAPVKEITDTLKSVTSDVIREHLAVFAENVVKFQKEYLERKYSERGKSDGFEDYEDNPSGRRLNKPEFVIAPYFYMAVDDFDDWFKLNIESINCVVGKGEPNVAGQIVIEKQVLLDSKYLDQIISEYASLKIGSILLWVDNFDESSVSLKYLEGFNRLIDGLRDKKVINLYGGFYSLLLSKLGKLSGFCHGPGYGESREIKPVGGGIPTAKFYLPSLCKRIRFETALAVLKQYKVTKANYFNKVCPCKKCKEIIGKKGDFEKNFFEFGRYVLAKSGSGREVPTQKTLLNNQLHYLLRRFKDLNTLDLDVFLETANAFINWNNKERSVSAQHLSDWIQALKIR